LIETAGSQAPGDEAFSEIFHPLAHRLLERCDAVVRIGGASVAADEMVATARTLGLHIFFDPAKVPSSS
jgi:hypothetical protein